LLSLGSREFEKHEQASRERMLLRKSSCYRRGRYFGAFVEEAIKNFCFDKEFLDGEVKESRCKFLS